MSWPRHNLFLLPVDLLLNSFVLQSFEKPVLPVDTASFCTFVAEIQMLLLVPRAVFSYSTVYEYTNIYDIDYDILYGISGNIYENMFLTKRITRTPGTGLFANMFANMFANIV